MKIIRILGILAAGMLLMASCSEETAIEETPITPTEEGDGVVRLTLCSSAGKVAKTRAVGETLTGKATDEEKAVGTVFAVLFKDSDTSKGGVDNADTFFKAVRLTTTEGDDGSLTTEFSAGRGNYQICFVANSGTALTVSIAKLKAGVSTVADFKALVEQQDPATKDGGMLMVSDFCAAAVTSDKETDLGNVTLERAMARIDIVNLADGITIDSVRFVNRTVKSILISDNLVGAFNTEYVEAEKMYPDLAIVGDSKGTSDGCRYEAKIYSYEQYGTDGNAPSLKVYYSIGEDSYSHTIEFENSDGQIHLVRNRLYTVNIGNAQGKLTFTLSVADWNVGTVMDVTSDELLRGIEYSHAKVGDIMLSDGTLVRLEDDDELSDEQKKKAIGVVAYLYTDADRNTKAGSYGLVMAIKNASENVMWSSVVSDSIAKANETVGDAYNYSYNGYDFLQKLDEYYETNMKRFINVKENCMKTYFPAFYAALYTYPETVAVPEWTTGWYVPSVREWTDILGALGGLTVADVAVSTNDTYTNAGGEAIFTKVNTVMSKMGTGNYDPFESGNKYWTSSENSKSDAYYLEYSSSGLIIGHAYKQTDGTAITRLVLGF